MWSFFRKRSSNSAPALIPAPSTPEKNRVDELANRLQREGKIADLETELKRIDNPSLTRAERESWWHLHGIVSFNAGRDDEALSRFKEGYERFQDSANLAFSLGQQYIRAGDIESGFRLFKKSSFPRSSREFVLAQTRYAYLWNRYDEGRGFLRPFFDAYKKLKILDDHFLYVRGLPFFGRWWSYLMALSVLSGDYREVEEATEYAAQNFSDYDFEYLKEELAAHRDDQPDSLLIPLEKRLAETPAGNFPTGYGRMRIAVLKARSALTMQAAEQLLDLVTLIDRDFPWLQDIRTLAKAEAARRFNCPEVEQEYVSAFLVRQPLLFEPDIALDFYLLRYQEFLKPRLKVS